MSAISFIKFVRTLGVTLTPAQHVLCAVAYDGMNPADFTDPIQRALAVELFGGVSVIPARARRVACHLCGARGGKSYVLVALRLLHLALVVNLMGDGVRPGLAPNERATALIVAPDMRLAAQTWRFALGAAQSNKLIAPMIGKIWETTFRTAFEIHRPDCGRIVVVECLPATKGGSAIRARNLVGAALEECCFFKDEKTGAINDDAIFTAVTPRIMLGGQTLLVSTAFGRSGKMYDLHTANWRRPGTAIAATAPTILLNPAKAEEVSIETERDPVNAAREFGCKWMAGTMDGFFSHDAIEQAIHPQAGDRSYFVKAPNGLWPKSALGSEIRVAVAAPGTIVVVYKSAEGDFWLTEASEAQAKPDAPLRPSDVVAHFSAVCSAHGTRWIVGNTRFRDALSEELGKSRLSFSASTEDVTAAHIETRSILHAGRLHIPRHVRLIDQMKKLISRESIDGGLTLSYPRDPRDAGQADVLGPLVAALAHRNGERIAPPVPEVPKTEAELIRANTAAIWASYDRRRAEEGFRAEEGSLWQESQGWGNWDGRS